MRTDEEELLARASELVARGWCQSALARDRDGRSIEPWRSSARAWSPLGALLAAAYLGSADSLVSFRVCYTCVALSTGGRVEEWNGAPWRTRQHVLNAFTRASDFVPVARRDLLRAAAGGSAGPSAVDDPGRPARNLSSAL